MVDQLLGQVVVDFLVRQETARLAHLDERLQLLAALGDLFFGELGLVEAELAHQRALLGARDLHAQRLGLGGDVGLHGDDRLSFEVGLEVGQVDVGGFGLGGLVVALALLRRDSLGRDHASALGGGLGRLRRRRRLLFRLDSGRLGFGSRAGGFRRGGFLGGHAVPRRVTGSTAASPAIELRTFVRNSRSCRWARSGPRGATPGSNAGRAGAG